MAALAPHDAHGVETPSDGSPYTTSPDDLFADINWPEDEFESPLSCNEGFSADSDKFENDSLKVGQPKQMTLSSLTYIRVKSASVKMQPPCWPTTVSLTTPMILSILQSLMEDLGSPRKLGAS